MLQLFPKSFPPEFTPNAGKKITKRLAKTAPYAPFCPKDSPPQSKDLAAARAVRRTLRSLRSVLAQRDLPAARAIRALARCQKRAKLPAEPDEDLEILLAVSTVLRELDGR
jgi:hypothetical protein